MLPLSKPHSAPPGHPLICLTPLPPRNSSSHTITFFFFFLLKIVVSSLSDFKESLGKPYLWVEMLLKELLPCYSAVVPSLHGDRVSAERVPGTSFSRNQQPYLASGCT